MEGLFATFAVTPTFTSEMVLRGTSRHSTTLGLGHVRVRAMLRHRSHVRTPDYEKGWDRGNPRASNHALIPFEGTGYAIKMQQKHVPYMGEISKFSLT